MNLQDFVSETLTQIIDGVGDAQTKVAQRREETGGEEAIGQRVNPVRLPAEWVSFDVAVTVEQGEGTKASIGVFSGVFGLGVQGESESKNVSLSRINFKVPIRYP